MKTLIGGTHTGLVRETNQDRYETVRLSDTLSFAVVCDGMGGENGGGIASEIAATHMREALLRDLAEDMTEASLRGVLLSAVAGANALVHAAAQKDPNLFGMGTTMIAAVFSHRTMYVACVGDSRLYRAGPDREIQVTRDHTVVQMLLDIGEISEEDAKRHPKRHFITRAVGVSDDIDADFLVQELEGDDIVLICSDGLYNYLSPGFYPMLERCVREQSVQSLIDFALESGGADNITAVVAR